MDAATVLGEFDPQEPIYAVLDGARDNRIRGWVLDTRAAAWCLYRGPLPGELEAAAPWLLKLARGAEYTERFFRMGWDNAWGILLSAPAPSRELRRHLRKFLVVRTEDRERLVFRYYDPRVLRIFLPTCTADELTQFFGPVTAMVAEGEEPGSFHVFRQSAAGLSTTTRERR